LKANLGPWTQLAVSPDVLPPAVEELVEVQQRTFMAIQNDGGSNYSDYYADSGFATLGRNSTMQPSNSYNDIPSSMPPPAFKPAPANPSVPVTAFSQFAAAAQAPAPAAPVFAAPVFSAPAPAPAPVFAAPVFPPPAPAPVQAAPVDTVVRVGDSVRGVYDYDGGADKLSFKKNDVMTVLEADGSGWCLGDLNQSKFPCRHLPIPPPPPQLPRLPCLQ